MSGVPGPVMGGGEGVSGVPGPVMGGGRGLCASGEQKFALVVSLVWA